MAKPLKLNMGDVFGSLKYIRDGKKRKQPSGLLVRTARVKCLECGKIFNTLLLHFVRNRASCKCVMHGDVKTPLHNSWRAMKNRCLPTYFQKQYYYEKGVVVFDGWRRSYFVFKKWALKNGYKTGLQIDRIDNSKGYSPENCRFVTQKQNLANRDIAIMVNYGGDEIALTLLCSKLGFDESRYALIYNRISRGWAHEKAINTPAKIGNYKRREKN